MDWFERLTGFREAGYAQTQRRLSVEDGRLRSDASSASHGVGTFEFPSLAELRARSRPSSGALRLSIVAGEVRKLHRAPEFAGALFQVASQFNLLEMPSPHVTPEDGVTGYAGDHTQGPACALAAGAATIFRNYLVPCNGSVGQTQLHQLDGLADLGTELSRRSGLPIRELWDMRNGYALATRSGLQAINAALQPLDEATRDALRARLRIGVHSRVEVTDGDAPHPLVSQAFCAALPVAYTRVPSALWEPLATLVLEAAYEATLYAALENAASGGSNVALLTLLGGGVFGNDEHWILAAMRRALEQARGWDLDVHIVCYRAPTQATQDLFNALNS